VNGLTNLFQGPFLDHHRYSWFEIAWYAGGFLLWVPAYIAIIGIARRERRLEIPIVAATGNISWELLWGVFYRVDMGWGLQFIYLGAFVIDAGILIAALRFGGEELEGLRDPRWFPLIVVGLLAGWGAIEATLRTSHVELPLGSVSAYLVNVVESAAYLWYGLSRDPRSMSFTVAWSKGLGTGMVTVFVFMRYDQPLVRTMAVIVALLDLVYLMVLRQGRRRAAPVG
jgi:hypothetical protein